MLKLVFSYVTKNTQVDIYVSDAEEGAVISKVIILCFGDFPAEVNPRTERKHGNTAGLKMLSAVVVE